MRDKAKYLIVISYDAFSEDNWDMAKDLPNLSSLIENGSYTNKLRSIFPTMTYVAHTTIVTGVYPDKHGIIHNNPLQPFVEEDRQEWYWYSRSINTPTIYELVNSNNLTTAGFLWPVTGKASIKYNIPEMAAINDENQAIKVLKNGSPIFTIGMELKFGKYRNGIKQPQLDDFTKLCAAETIRKKKPNLLMMHLIDLDDAKHKYGPDSSEIEHVLKRMDRRIGDIIRAVDDAGIREDTVFLVLGDHGHIKIDYKVHLNNVLRDRGLIYKVDGRWEWKAYIQSAGGSAYVHIKDKDYETEKLVLEILNDIIKNEEFGIESIYDREEMKELHMHESVRYAIEAKKGYTFLDNLTDFLREDLKSNNIGYGNHGYSPFKEGYRCNLVLSGSSIKKGWDLGDINMVDIAPTMAAILGLEMKNTDGRILTDAFMFD